MASLVDWLAYSGARKSDGTVVASGYAYFYQPDTVSTQTTVYSDEDGLVAIAQPLQLDASGRGIAYLKTPAKIQIRDSGGVTVVEVEDRSNTVNAAQVEIENAAVIGTSLINGTQVAGGRTDLDTFITRLGTSMGGTDGKYRESPTATARALSDAIGQFVTLEDFGGAGDDATDNTTPFANAIARCQTSGKPLKLQAGVYRVTGTIAITSAEGFRMYGAGRNESSIKQMGTAVDTLSIDEGVIHSHVELRDFQIYANTTSSGAAITFGAGTYSPTLVNLSVQGHRTGYDLSAASYGCLDRCMVESTDGNASCIGFRLGASVSAIHCYTTQTSTGTGFTFEGAFARAWNCYVNSATTGFSFLASDCQALYGTVFSATTGFSVGAVARSGCVGCSSTTATSDFTTNVSATSVVDLLSHFTTRTINDFGGTQLSPRPIVMTKVRTTITSAVGGSWTPNPSAGPIQCLLYNMGGAAQTLTVNATSTTGLVDGQRMFLLIQLGPSPNALTVTWNAQYVFSTASAGLATIGAAAVYSCSEWIWSSSASKWMHLSPSNVQTPNTSGTLLW